MAALPLCKVVNLADFSHPDFERTQRTHNMSSTGPVHRKSWEMVMALYSLTTLGALGDSAEVLGIGAGREQTIGALSHACRRVFATDLYLTPGGWQAVASAKLLVDPRPFFTSINPRRVVFQHADGRHLPYEEGTFDGLFSSSSFEHFGDARDVRKAVEEACRVLKSGGIAAISTEYKISGPGVGWDNVQVFDRDRIVQVWLEGISWDLVDEVNYDLDDSPYVDFDRTFVDPVYRDTVDPHLYLETRTFGYRCTSLHLTFRKR